ncbi:hypothetical protein [Phenylobacterium sp.]|uniref:hypothetical protein n=1 Tax=Phenylobacterium sp. TaxID=1871053 RepID=UPI0027233E7D|nr:hypothetical protein [Phenylobacterium sp.]MDO8802647.1 hypothetical protein [Phenylobacterium sp.]
MRTLLIPATLLALACATTASAQSYSRAIDPSDRGGQPYPTDRAPRDDGYRQPGATPLDDRYAQQDGYPQDAYRQQPAYRRPLGKKYRRAQAAVSRYSAPGRPVYYNDGMIRTGRDYPAGTVGLNGH